LGASNAQAATTDCIGDSADGLALCTAPTVSSYSYNVCTETFSSYYDGPARSCYADFPTSGGGVLNDGKCYASWLTGCPTSAQQPTWTGWSTQGQNYSSAACWSIVTKMVNGIYVDQWATVAGTKIGKDGNNQCVVASALAPIIVLWQHRSLDCPTGYAKSSLPNGDMVCKMFLSPDCPMCGDPIEVATGRQLQTDVDYASPGLTFSRSYDSLGSYRPPWAPQQMQKPLGEYWTHNFESRVYPTANNSYVMAAVLRPNGAIRYFDTNGRELLGSGSGGLLEKLTDGGNVVGFRYRPSQTEVEEYDASGALTALTRPGVNLSLQYTAGMLTTVSDQQGRTLSFTYDGAGYLATMVDPGGNVTKYTTAAPGSFPNRNLTLVTYADTKTRAYAYGEAPYTSGATLPYALTGITDENGNRFATFSYKNTGKAYDATHALGAEKTTFNVLDATNVNVVNALGYAEKYTFQSAGVFRTTAVTRPCIGNGCVGSTQTTMAYDGSGNLTSTTDWNGNTTTYQYDGATKIAVQKVEAAGKAEQRTSTVALHASLPVATQIAEPQRITSYVYNGDGGVTCGFLADGVTPVPGVVCSKTERMTTDVAGASGLSATTVGNPRTWSFTYNANGRVLTVDGPRTDVSDLTTFTYYADDDVDILRRGYVATIADPAGHVTKIDAYDAFGGVASSTDPNGLTTTTTIDARGRVLSRSVGTQATTHTYDAAGNVVATLFPDGTARAFTYDLAHRLVGTADNGGNHKTFSLDALGHVTQEQVLDPSNVVVGTHSRTFDILGRLTTEVGANNQTTTFTYDPNGNVLTRVDPLGRATNFTYDALDRMTGMSTAGAAYTFAYDARDHVVSLVAPRGVTTTYVYDGFGQLLEIHSPEAGTRTYAYDLAGNVKTSTDAKNQVTTYTYDALNRPTLIGYADGSQATLTYDQGTNGIGHVTTIADSTGSTSYVYDAYGHVTEETVVFPSTLSTLSLTVKYGYDAYGRRTSVTYPSGRTVDLAYDNLGNVSKVQTTSSGSTSTLADSIAYAPFGRFTSFTPPTAAPSTRTFDGDGRMTSYTTGTVKWNVTYDAASRVTSIADAANASDSRTFTYDDLDRLIQAVTPAGTEAMTYDASGNRLTRDLGGTNQTFTYAGDSNRILTASAPTPRTYTYDANGMPTSDGTHQFNYDARGRLVGVTTASTAGLYFIDARGRRLAKEAR
jgi:YD repeat-containing protein